MFGLEWFVSRIRRVASEAAESAVVEGAAEGICRGIERVTGQRPDLPNIPALECEDPPRRGPGRPKKIR
jgi:hypothetical protein